MNAQDKIAKILRADKDFIYRIDKRLGAVTGKRGIFEKIVSENEKEIRNSLLALGVSSKASAKEVIDALISKIEADDHKIFRALGEPSCSNHEDCNKVLAAAKEVAGTNHGFFLKKEKAIEFLQSEPPQKIMAYLKYQTVQAMLAKEDLFEVWSALRFIESSDWLNNVFFKQYEALVPSDFEEREITVKALSPKWAAAAETFVMKKWHNISHLKELGVIFIIPITLGISGELLRMMSLIFHYLHEVSFYSRLFRKSAESEADFSANVISLLRGDVLDKRFPESEKSLWLVIQRYLAKDDENDWRLFFPHINPEAIHWAKAEEDLIKLGNFLNNGNGELGFWHNLDWVGDYFKDEIGNEALTSFNLVDTVMSLVKEKEMIKYLYHHEEALWNKIFAEYFGEEELKRYAAEYLLRGYFEI